MKAIVGALARWSWLLIICILVGYFGGKIIATLIPPNYQSIAIIQLNAQSHGTGLVQPVSAYGTLITSDAVVGTVLKNYPKLDRTNFVSKQLVVASSTTSQTISITVTVPSAKDAANLANSLANLLVSQQNAVIKQQFAKEIALLQSYINAEQKIIDNLNQKIINTPTTSTATIQEYQGQVSQQRNLQDQNNTQLQSIQTDQALHSEPLSIVQTAAVPTKPSSLVGLIPIMPVFLVVMLIIGIAAISLIEQSSGRIHGVATLQQKANMSILGALNWTSHSPQSTSLQAICDANTPYAEACRIMMADVLFHAEEEQARILAVTSSKVKSGNSSIAAQLAALLAQSKRRVLLIDANLYEPSLHKRLNVPNETGLAKMLQEARVVKVAVTPSSKDAGMEIADQLPVDSYIMATPIQNLFLVPAGKPNMNPSSLLSMTEMKQFLIWASKRTDFVIIDCPALTHAESHVLGALSDQTYLVVDATRDRVKKVVNAKDDLLNTGVKLSGLIVNKLGRWI